MRDCTALRRVIIIKHLYRTLYLQSALGPFVLLFLTVALWGRLVLLNLFYLPAGLLSFKCFEINLEESKPFSVWKNKVGKKNPWWKFVLKKKSPREPVCWRRGSELIKGARIASIRLESNRESDRSAIHGVGWICGLSSSQTDKRPTSPAVYTLYTSGGWVLFIFVSGSHGPTCNRNWHTEKENTAQLLWDSIMHPSFNSTQEEI